MRSYLIAAFALPLLLTGASAQDKPDLKDPRLKASYAIGADIGNAFKKQELDLDPKAVAAGIADALAGKTTLNEAEIRATLEEFQKTFASKAEARSKVAGEKNVKEGETFLAANSKKEGVKTTASGLQYKVLTSGKGKTPTAADTVKVHYKGTLIDGSVFDSSIDRGEPAEFPVGGVIKGWTEALLLMKEGAKWQLFIPSDLAYGERGDRKSVV